MYQILKGETDGDADWGCSEAGESALRATEDLRKHRNSAANSAGSQGNGGTASGSQSAAGQEFPLSDSHHRRGPRRADTPNPLSFSVVPPNNSSLHPLSSDSQRVGTRATASSTPPPPDCFDVGDIPGNQGEATAPGPAAKDIPDILTSDVTPKDPGPSVLAQTAKRVAVPKLAVVQPRMGPAAGCGLNDLTKLERARCNAQLSSNSNSSSLALGQQSAPSTDEEDAGVALPRKRALDLPLDRPPKRPSLRRSFPLPNPRSINRPGGAGASDDEAPVVRAPADKTRRKK